ncbi:Hypothetical protein A7982_06263 [Minicystis rosea]|nr:Hypothetical protein A7982_06263 [Minicystis rosea]
MMRIRPFIAVSFVSALLASGCMIGEAEDGEESWGEAQQPQVDGGYKVWRQVTFTFTDPAQTQLGKVFVFNRAAFGYQPGSEYWFVNRSSLGLLGRYGITISSTDLNSTVSPVDPSYASEQAFTLDQYPTSGWGSAWTGDPVAGGVLHAGANGQYLRLSASPASSTGPASLAGVTWYQVLPTGSTPHNITPSGTFSLAGSSVGVPTGSVGYDVNQTP